MYLQKAYSQLIYSEKYEQDSFLLPSISDKLNSDVSESNDFDLSSEGPSSFELPRLSLRIEHLAAHNAPSDSVLASKTHCDLQLCMKSASEAHQNKLHEEEEAVELTSHEDV